MMKISLPETIQQIERAIPPVYALENDPIGLQIGDNAAEVSNIMLALEVTERIIDQTKAKDAELLVVHHPLIFRPLKRLTQRTIPERLAIRLIRENIALYAMHTNLDLHPQGMGLDWGGKLGLVDLKPILPKPQSGSYKLVTFVPEDHLDHLRDALAGAGAGCIGEYDHCSFSHPGTGTFRGSDLSHPVVGERGRLEKEPEVRLEMILPQSAVGRVVSALYKAHPYEEPAYDLYALADFKRLEHVIWRGRFPKPQSWKAFLERIRNSIPGFTGGRVVQPRKRTQIHTVALSTGSGSSCLPLVLGLGVDAYLTGELGYHLLWEAEQAGLPCVAVGHFESEQFFSGTVKRILTAHQFQLPLHLAQDMVPAKMFC